MSQVKVSKFLKNKKKEKHDTFNFCFLVIFPLRLLVRPQMGLVWMTLVMSVLEDGDPVRSGLCIVSCGSMSTCW